jgi:hypothetical protein
METSILELQKLLLVEGPHSEFAEISRHDAVWRFFRNPKAWVLWKWHIISGLFLDVLSVRANRR